jgi:hypothetical protein
VLLIAGPLFSWGCTGGWFLAESQKTITMFSDSLLEHYQRPLRFPGDQRASTLNPSAVLFYQRFVFFQILNPVQIFQRIDVVADPETIELARCIRAIRSHQQLAHDFNFRQAFVNQPFHCFGQIKYFFIAHYVLCSK